MKSLFRVIFGCRHKRLTFPQTPPKGRRVTAASITGCYVVCLDCGTEFPYSLDCMRAILREHDWESAEDAPALLERIAL